MRRLGAAATVPMAVLLTGCTGPDEPEPEPLAPWAWEMPRCVAYLPERYEAPERRVEASTSAGVITEVYESGWGPEAFAEIRSVVHNCSSFEDGDLREQNLIVVTGFGGDESILVETVRIGEACAPHRDLCEPSRPVQTSYAAAVRTGDSIVTVRVHGLDRDETLCLAGAEDATCGSGRT